MADFTIICTLDGKTFEDPMEVNDLEVLCVYDGPNIQPSITQEKITLLNDAAHYVCGYIANGKQGAGPGIFQGLPYKIQISEDGFTDTIFDGYIDFTKEFVIHNPGKVEVHIIEFETLNDIQLRLKALTFTYLQSLGKFTDVDYTKVNTIVRPFDRDIQALQLALTEFMLATQIADLARQLGKEDSIVISSGGLLVAYLPLALVLDAIYLAILIVEFILLFDKLINLYIPIPVKNKGITFRRALVNIFKHLGYKFKSSIKDLDRVYLPSKPDENNLTKGIPHSSDYGQSCSDFVELCTSLFEARYAVVDGTVELHTINKPFWSLKGDYIIPDVLYEIIRYNPDENIANKVFSFITDDLDDWTTKNYTGTTTEVITGPLNPSPNPRMELNRGFSKTEFPLALGNDSGILDGVIDSVNQIAGNLNKFMNKLNSLFPTLVFKNINTNFAFTDALKVSGKTWSKPKMLYVVNGSIPSNHRQLLSSATIYRDYKSASSFLPTNPLGQKRIFNDVEVPVRYADFRAMKRNSYAVNKAGKAAKVEKLLWKIGRDRGTINYWVNEVYTKNLKETIITP